MAWNLGPAQSIIQAMTESTDGAPSMDIHLQLFAESSKDVAVFLLNQGLNYDVSEANHFLHAGRSLEILSLLWKGEAVHLTLYEQDDQRQIAKSAGNRKIEKADLNAVRALIKENSSE